MNRLLSPLRLGLVAGAIAALGLVGPVAQAKEAPQAADIVDTAVAAGAFKTLVTAVQAAGLVETLKGPGPLTVFAPSDEAFAKVPADVLQGLLADKAKLTQVLTYHVVPGKVLAADAAKVAWAPTVQGSDLRVTQQGGGVQVDGANVVKADIACSNGVIHVIDRVILPRQDIVGTAVAAKSFGTLVAAVQAAGLVEALQAKGPFTVFAPNDAAFAALPAGTVDGLLKDKPALTRVLTYHVLPSRVLSTDLAEGTVEVKTLAGATLKVTKAKDGSVTVNGAKVIA
ncbi:MAG: fasciclin domain-containing protein, partial [Planctomycetia bacterium]